MDQKISKLKYFLDFWAFSPQELNSHAASKLRLLPSDQLSDVLNDVLDESERRIQKNPPPFLPLNPSLIPKRNQARQKMATLSQPRFLQLIYAVYSEIPLRTDLLPSKSLKNNDNSVEVSRNITPQRSPSPKMQNNSIQLHQTSPNLKISSRTSPVLKNNSLQPHQTSPNLKSSQPHQTSPKLKNSSLNSSSKLQNESLQFSPRLQTNSSQIHPSSHSNTTRDLEIALQENKSLNEALNSTRNLLNQSDLKVTKLSNELSLMNKDYDELVANNADIKLEAGKLLEDVKNLTATIRSISEEKDDLKAEIESRDRQIQEMAKRLREKEDAIQNLTNQLNSALDNQNTLSMPSIQKQASFNNSRGNFGSDNHVAEVSKDRYHISRADSGSDNFQQKQQQQIIVSDSMINQYTLFQDFDKATEQLKLAAQKPTATLVLAPMKQVILSCKAITETGDAIQNSSNKSHTFSNDFKNIKESLSENLTALMDHSKNHAKAGGTHRKQIETGCLQLAKPVRKMIELILSHEKMLQLNDNSRSGIQSPNSFANSKTPTMMGDYNDNTLKDNPFTTNPTKTHHQNQVQQQNNNNDPPPMNIPDLRLYLEDQTEDIARTIQDLLATMRTVQPTSTTLGPMIKDVLILVDNIIFETKSTLDHLKIPEGKIDDVLELLEKDREKLVDLSQVLSSGNSQAKQLIANLSYSIAKNAKELLRLLDTF